MGETISSHNFNDTPLEDNPWDELANETKAFTTEAPGPVDTPDYMETAKASAVDLQEHEQLRTFEIKNLAPTDKLEQAAEALYLTDQYILPDLFGDEERAKKLIGALFSDKPDVMFSYDKTLVAKDEEDNIAGILVYRDSDCKPWDSEATKRKFEATGVEMPENFDRANNVYMPKITGEMAPGTAEIEFVGVRNEYRSRGIGEQLIQSLADNPAYDELHLDVLDSHPWARKSYDDLGFEADGEKFGNYPDGSESVQHMILRKEE